MKVKIRRGMFETNSSSMHSMVVMKSDEKYSEEEILEEIRLCRDSKTKEENCAWRIYDWDLEFGRSPFRVLCSFENKWRYACASLVGEYNDETYKKLVTIAKKYIPGLKKIELPMASKRIPSKDDESEKDDEYVQKYGKTENELVEYLEKKQEEWGMDIDYWKTSDHYWAFKKPFTGYVDENILSGFLEKEKIGLEEFLTNKRYVVIQDGDEYCYWDDMKKSGLVNMDKIEKEY